MMAKPAVEPRARCALMMPDAMPERSAGIDAMATLVVGASARPPAVADEDQADEDDDDRDRRRPIAMTTRPTTSRTTPTSVGLRPPTRAAMPPEIGDRMMVGTVKASISTPARSGL